MTPVHVLVHGAWGGSYGFREVRRLLAGRGREVLTPSLTGIGERSHLTGPHVDLSLHVRDVVNTFRYDDLDDVVLLGFSYGGMVVAGASEHIGDRVRHLVLLDAFLPRDGESVTVLSGRAFPDTVDGLGARWLVPPVDRQYANPAQQAWSEVRRTAQPVRTLTEPVRMTVALEERAFARTYVRATEDPHGEMFDVSAARARDSPAWDYREIATSHLVAQTRPGELAELLLELG